MELSDYFLNKIKDAIYKVSTGYWTVDQAFEEIKICVE